MQDIYRLNIPIGALSEAIESLESGKITNDTIRVPVRATPPMVSIKNSKDYPKDINYSELVFNRSGSSWYLVTIIKHS